MEELSFFSEELITSAENSVIMHHRGYKFAIIVGKLGCSHGSPLAEIAPAVIMALWRSLLRTWLVFLPAIAVELVEVMTREEPFRANLKPLTDRFPDMLPRMFRPWPPLVVRPAVVGLAIRVIAAVVMEA